MKKIPLIVRSIFCRKYELFCCEGIRVKIIAPGIKKQHLKASQFYAGNGTLFLYAVVLMAHSLNLSTEISMKSIGSFCRNMTI